MKQDFELVSQQESGQRSDVGGKAKQLGVLHRLAAVPEFFVISTSSFDYYCAHQKLPPGLIDSVMSRASAMSSGLVAVRSSVNCEDGFSDSFAGVFDTHLYVPLAHIEEKILAVYRSLDSERVRTYCQEKSIATELKMAIVIQRMANAQAAGVAFSRAPIAPTADVMIEAGLGLGEGVVAGKVAVDYWRYSRLGDLLDEGVKRKDSRMVAGPDGGLVMEAVPAERQELPALSAAQRLELFRAILKLEDQLGHPVDVEWALVDGSFQFLQVRPITRDFPRLASYVDTNLAESYPGVSSPFTASFVKVGYRNVFVEAAVLLGARGDRLSRLMPHFESLIGESGHHLYYHLESYYAMLASLPGGEKNIENWHRMIGGKADGLAVRVRPEAAGLTDTIRGVFLFLRFTWNIDHVIGRFVDSLEAREKVVRQGLLESPSAEETIKIVANLIHRPIGFGLQLLVDNVIMLGLRPLTRLLVKHQVPENRLADFLKTNEEIESLLPLFILQEIVNAMPMDFWPDWDRAVGQSSEWDGYQTIWSLLLGEGHHHEVKELKDFLHRFGDRSFEELKMESLTFRQSPRAFSEMLIFLRSSPTTATEHHEREPLQQGRWSFWDRQQWRFYAHWTKKAIFWREKTRMQRGRFYNLVREGIHRVAAQLREEHPPMQSRELRDFFSVTLPEYEGFARGELTAAQLHEKMSERQDWKTLKREYPEFLIIGEGETPFASRGTVEASPGILQGRCACGGEVSGRPLVLDDPRDALKRSDLSECILVTRHTDPAWVYIMARCRGLVSEKGSLLSHTAIIGRELGIPTVVGVKDATRILAAAESITLRADHGEVVIHGH